MASNPALTCKPELVVYDMPDLDADLPIGEHHHHTAGDEEATAAALNGTLTCKTEHIVDNETVDELLARAERMIAQNQESIELHQMSYELIQTLDESVMDEFVDSTLADADQAISNAQHILDESSVDDSVLEITELQRPTPHVISDGEDDDDVIFVSQQAAPSVSIIVDLSQDSPVAEQPAPSPPVVDYIPPQFPPNPLFTTHTEPFHQSTTTPVIDYIPSQFPSHHVFTTHHTAPIVPSTSQQSLFGQVVHRNMSMDLVPAPITYHSIPTVPADMYHPPPPVLPISHPLQPSSPKRSRTEEPTSAQIRCPVCLEHPFDNQPTSTVCGHVFCFPCITMAVKQNKKCPMCNRKLTAKQMHKLYV